MPPRRTARSRVRPALALAAALVAGAVVPALPSPAHAGDLDPREAGIGAVVGASYSPTELQRGQVRRRIGAGFAWGFFVDVPLTDTFIIAPAATLYEIDLGSGNRPVTDIDLNFKLLLPVGPVRLGPGVMVGLSNAEQTYSAHLGALAYVGVGLVGNLEGFVMAQYKKLWRAQQNVDDLHGYVGGLFRF